MKTHARSSETAHIEVNTLKESPGLAESNPTRSLGCVCNPLDLHVRFLFLLCFLNFALSLSRATRSSSVSSSSSSSAGEENLVSDYHDAPRQSGRPLQCSMARSVPSCFHHSQGRSTSEFHRVPSFSSSNHLAQSTFIVFGRSAPSRRWGQ